jgi:hypothetical protein
MPKAAHDHSDNEKFCNDLKGSKSCRMSEWPLKMFQGFPTSKLHTARHHIMWLLKLLLRIAI